MTSSSTAFAARTSLSLQELAHCAPAVFADRAADCTGPKYVFISTRDIVTALIDAGFEPTLAVQTRARDGNAGYARHMLRFQPVVQTLSLDDVLGEIVLINSHDGRCAYQLRAGLFRPVCTNGMLTAIGDFGLIHVSHRGNVVANVVEAAQRITREFGRVGEAVEQMRGTQLSGGQQLDFAREALALRFPDATEPPVQPAQLLERRRMADIGDDVWRTFNAVQEAVLQRRAVRPYGHGPRDAHPQHPGDPGERPAEHRPVEAGARAHRPLRRPGRGRAPAPFRRPGQFAVASHRRCASRPPRPVGALLRILPSRRHRRLWEQGGSRPHIPNRCCAWLSLVRSPPRCAQQASAELSRSVPGPLHLIQGPPGWSFPHQAAWCASTSCSKQYRCWFPTGSRPTTTAVVKLKRSMAHSWPLRWQIPL